jgi:hypothetical protein
MVLKVFLMAVLLLVSLDAGAVWAQGPAYPPLSEYMMAPEAEVALARSAAPEKVSARATVKVLTASGYEVTAQGDNGFVCIVMRGWAAATSAAAPNRDLVYNAKLRAPMQDAGRSRPLLGEAFGGGRREPMRLAQGQIWRVMAGGSYCPGEDVGRQGRGEVEKGHAGNAEDG